MGWRAGAAVTVRRGLVGTLIALLAGCAGPPPKQAYPVHPQVVSLNPCTDAILAQVADPGQVLAISHYSHDPRASSMTQAQAARFAATRGSVEEVLALRPDLVLGSTFTDPSTASAYARAGLRFQPIGIARNVAESREQIRQIATLVGHGDRGEALIARIDRALALSAPPPDRAAVPAVVWQAGGIVPGSDALIVELMGHAGFANHAARQGLGQADMLSLERLLAHPPQVLFVVSDGGDSADRLRTHPALDRLEGTQRRALDARLLYCGGPTIIEAASWLAAMRRSMGHGGQDV